MTINIDTLFARIGHAIKAAQDLDDTAMADFATQVRVFEEDLDTETHEFQQTVLGNLESQLDTGLGTVGSLAQQLVGNPIQNLIIETVHQDTPLLNKSIDSALAILLDQMDDFGESLDQSTVGYSMDYGENSSSGGTGDNYGNGIILCCTKRGDGQVNQFILAETIRCEVTAVSSNGTATWRLTAEPAEALTHPDWPGGSGVTRNLTANVAGGSNLVLNGDFEDPDTYATTTPQYWIVAVGTAGTDVKLTSVETQTVTVNGTPTGGWYTLTFQDRNGDSHTTVPLTYNASASSVQTALRSLPTLGSVTVASTGTSPNLTHTVTFTDVPSPAQLTYTSALTGGTPIIAIATLVAASAYVARGARALEFVGDGATQTSILVPVSLSGRTCYGLNLWAAVDVTPAAGALTVDLVDGVTNDVLNDDEGNANSIAVDLTGLTGSLAAQGGCFHTPLTLPNQVYLRLRLSTALSSGTSLFVDELCLVAMTELYPGGLFAAAFAGPQNHAVEDYAEIAATNDRAGAMHEWLHRFLNLGAKRFLFPVANPGTQPDSLIT